MVRPAGRIGAVIPGGINMIALLVIALAIGGYLVYALVNPEKF